MTAPTNTVQTYGSVGNREDLADVIYNISPTDTPLLSNVERTPATGVNHEWQTDSLAAAGTNTQKEGDDAAGTAHSPTKRVGNYCQISSKTVIVSGTQRAVNSAGRADELGYQVAKKGKELKRDMEYALVRNQAKVAGALGTTSATATARALGGLETWLSTNFTSVGTGTAQAVPGEGAATTDSTIAGTFTKASLDTVIQDCWTQGGEPNMIMCSARNKVILSGFDGIAALQRDVTDSSTKLIGGGVDFYQSDFGDFKVVPNRYVRDEVVHVIDPEMIAVATLRDMVITDLAKTGDSDKKQLLTEFTLEVKNEAASGQVRDIG